MKAKINRIILNITYISDITEVNKKKSDFNPFKIGLIILVLY
jgi:hypothetical protein